MGLFDRFKKSDKNISLTNLINEPYEHRYFDECKFIWKNYVPRNGHSTVLQGELLREIEKLRCEAQDNGNINWNEDFAFFCDFIKETLLSQTIYSDEEKEKYKLILSYFKECGDYAVKYHSGQISDEDVEIEKIAYTDDNLYNIISDAIGKFNASCKKPVPFDCSRIPNR